MSKPIAVMTSDLHFNLNNLQVASDALEQVLISCRTRGLPLIIAGDLHDTKAIMRGEVVNALIKLFNRYKTVNKYILVGNHDLLNEKSEENALNFLRPYAWIIEHYSWIPQLSENIYFIPYQNSKEKIRELLPLAKPGSILIMHQGVLGAHMGEYITDNSSIDPNELSKFSVISGHYHKHQTVGTVTYIGSPYTTSFSEANDGPKGFLILNEDGTYTREILSLRKHIIIEYTLGQNEPKLEPIDTKHIMQVKVHGTRNQLDNFNREHLSASIGRNDFKLDKITIESDKLNVSTNTVQLSGQEILDAIIARLTENLEYKQVLKSLWRQLL